MAFTDIPEVGQPTPCDLLFSVTRRVVTYGPFFYPVDYRPTSDEAWSHAKESLGTPTTTVVPPDPIGSGGQAARGLTLLLASSEMVIEKHQNTGEPIFLMCHAYIKDLTDWHMVSYAATCYLHVWWNLVTRDGSGNLLSSDAQDWEWPGENVEDGCCCKASLNPDRTQTATWNKSDYSDSVNVNDGDALRPADPNPPDPGGGVPDPSSASASISFYLENIRWSFVQGYVPPADGGANGFPP